MNKKRSDGTGWSMKKIYILLIFLVALAFVFSLTVGKYSVSVSELPEIIFGKIFHLGQTWDDTTNTALFRIRIPRIVTAAIVGAALSVAGAAFQGIFCNPMVSPDILGASAGAGFGACTAIMMGMGSVVTQSFAFAFGIAAVFLCYGISQVVSRNKNMLFTLILTGMVVSSIFSSLISLTKFLADPDDKLPAITFWLMGGLNAVMLSRIKLLVMSVSVFLIPIFLLRRQLNVLSFGDDEARTLGTNVTFTRAVFILCGTVLTAATVSVVGMIGWIGLVIPHMARMIVGSNYERVIPVSAIIGAIFLMVIDDIARCAFLVEIPIGILTGMIGGPFFIYLLFKERKTD